MMGRSAYVDRVAYVASLHPNAVAVEDAAGGLTYARLVEVAGTLSSRLSTAAPAGSVVGVRFPQGRDCVVSMLAARSAGLGVLLLDPRHPSSRDGALCEEAAAAFILGPGTSAGMYPSVALTDLLLDGVALPVGGAAPPDVGFVLGTSGSTGRPKAVAHSDASMLAWGEPDAFGAGYGSGDVVLSLSSPSTLGGIAGITKCLMGGATARCLDMGDRGFSALVEVMRDGRVTAMRGTPSVLRSLASVVGFRDMARSVVSVTLHGEPVTWDDIAAMRRIFQPACLLRNSYGSTEAGGCAFHPAGAEGHGRLPAGIPNPGVSITVVDALGRPVPAGTEGEVRVAGGQNSLGVMSVGALLRHPPLEYGLSTGDLGRMLPGGVLEVLGRRDRAVKVNGVRIDLSEVEAAVRSCPHVSSAEVVAVPHGSGCRTVAFVVLDPAGDPRDVARQARGRLPGSTAPVVRALASLPMLPVGKVDLAALTRMAEAGA